MGNKITVTALRDALSAQDRSFAWLSRVSGVKYKRLLAEIKHATSPLTFDTVCATSAVLGIDLLTLMQKEDADA